MATFLIIDSVGIHRAELIAPNEANALDEFARLHWEQAAGPEVRAIRICTEGLVCALRNATGEEVTQDPYGSGVAKFGGRSYGTWGELAQVLDQVLEEYELPLGANAVRITTHYRRGDTGFEVDNTYATPMFLGEEDLPADDWMSQTTQTQYVWA